MDNVINYSSNYSIKNFIKNDIGSKYLNFDDVNALNVGIFGILTDVEASFGEDMANMVSTYTKELFPNLAENPESIYSYAGLYKVNDLLAKPAALGTVLFISQRDIIKYGENKGAYSQFFIDSGLVVSVDGHEFSLDYDIKITYRKYKDELVFSAMYDMPFVNHISDINNPYIKVKKISFKGETYIGLIVQLHKFSRSMITENIISNDRINLPSISFSFDDQLCNFEVLYKSPTSQQFIQLEKRIYTAQSTKNPFCFYKLTDEKEVELTFSSKDTSFQPKFNSELQIYMYTCNGESDNFPLYKGDNVIVKPGTEKYQYNQNLVIMAMVQTKSYGGQDMPSLDKIKDLYLDKMNTMDSYTSENDLRIYFNSVKNKLGNEINIIKKRDDIFRLFSAYSLMKDKNGDIFHTNTLNLDVLDTSILDDIGNAYIIKPGNVMKYNDESIDTVIIDKSLNVNSLPTSKNDFYYTCPFLIYLQKNPENISYYYNSINENMLLDYSYNNDESYVHFIATTLSIYRNAIVGDNEYVFTVKLNVSVDNYRAIVDEDKQDTGALKVKMVLPNSSGMDICSTDFVLIDSDIQKHEYTYQGKLKTNDYVSVNNEMTVIDVFDIQNSMNNQCSIPIDTSFKILTFFNYNDKNISHPYNIPDVKDYTLTNIYTNSSEDILNLMLPIPNCRSRFLFKDAGNGKFYFNISSIPLLSTQLTTDNDRFQYFMDNLKSQYLVVNNLMTRITNNFSIDMKLYNTYGRSRNCMINEEGIRLNRVNCGIHFKIKPILGADESELINKAKELIKKYTEGINTGVYNSIYISKLIQYLENDISEISYLKFVQINEYGTNVQVIDNKSLDLKKASKQELRSYIPEFLTFDLNDIIIEIIPINSKNK